MRSKICIPTAFVAIAAATTGTAFAQESGDAVYLRHHVDPPRNALELTLGTGYTEGFGQLTQQVGMPSVAQEGMALDLGIGYRLSPHWMIGLMGEFQEFNAQRAHSALGTVAGIQAAYHFAPSRRIDPWLGLGTGYRWLWEVYNENHTQVLTQGLQMARLLVGLDIRTSQEFAIGPVIGADFDEFLSQGNGGITNPGVSTFVHAGLMGRFDIGTFDHRPPPPTEQDVAQGGVTAPQRPAPAVEPPAPPAPPTIVYVPTPVVVEAPPPPVQAPPTIVYLSPSISVSSDILHACELKVGNSPQFAFDDSRLNGEDRDALDAVAKCFTSGPLAGKSMSLVGRADPRGSREYNLALGQRRASTVATYLMLHGIESDRIGKSSRGALDAEGTDEAGWANDRRVDITIAP